MADTSVSGQVGRLPGGPPDSPAHGLPAPRSIAVTKQGSTRNLSHELIDVVAGDALQDWADAGVIDYPSEAGHRAWRTLGLASRSTARTRSGATS
ncbi:MAG TPA: hypothetical protein VMV09_10440 [Candidatus Saccharimonadales bacterium]|nr:hypothetical protein [Candidatus Saccharimonadales bacterium]